MTRNTDTGLVRARVGDERGSAIVVALLSLLLLTALGLALTLTTTTETAISANQRMGQEAMNAADAALERAMQDLLALPDWNRALGGTEQSSFIDGGPGGTRALPDGTTVNLAELAEPRPVRPAGRLQRGRHRDQLAGATLGRQQPRVAAVRLRPGVGPAAGRHGQLADLRGGDGRRRSRPRPTAIR